VPMGAGSSENALPGLRQVTDADADWVTFVYIREFAAPGGGPTLACMWRDRQ
jgi:hypothetical protein